ncbi:MAG: UDP-N-acetylglucosamine pyrophosphorylase [Erysipelotrichia bacterium]|nr:UDP-N-acetylglucosamine pyrophosphorylase [Erysipelotrichia bacterium]
MNKLVVKTKDLFDLSESMLKDYLSKAKYPWEILPEIKQIILELLEKGIPGYHLLKEGVLVGEGVSIAPNVTIVPPAIIGAHTEIRHGAYLRGNVIVGDHCVLGNACEFKNCILLHHVQVPHFSYVGDSVLGNYAHLGAGVICSNLKSSKDQIVVRSETNYETGLKKFGAILGDYVDVGCQSVLNPGTVIGSHTQVYPLSMVRGVVAEKSIYKSKDNIVAKENR